MTASLVIRRMCTKHIPGLAIEDFAVVHAHTLCVVGTQIHGMYYDSNGRCGHFTMPVCEFDQLEYIELGREDEISFANSPVE